MPAFLSLGLVTNLNCSLGLLSVFFRDIVPPTKAISVFTAQGGCTFVIHFISMLMSFLTLFFFLVHLLLFPTLQWVYFFLQALLFIYLIQFTLLLHVRQVPLSIINLTVQNSLTQLITHLATPLILIHDTLIILVIFLLYMIIFFSHHLLLQPYLITYKTHNNLSHQLLPLHPVLLSSILITWLAGPNVAFSNPRYFLLGLFPLLPSLSGLLYNLQIRQ